MKFPPKPTSKDVKEYRDTQECGLYEAKREVLKAWQRRTLREIQLQLNGGWASEASLFPVLVDLVETIIDP